MSDSNYSRVAVYVDGFNLYYGLKSANWRRFYWLDIRKLAESLLKEGQELTVVKYFTARTSGSLPNHTPEEAEEAEKRLLRQAKYLTALSVVGGVQIFEGVYQSKPKYCKVCESPYYRHEEKKTDVSIATEILRDAFQDRYDVAILISADSDLVPAFSAVRELFASKKVVSVFPPERAGKELRKISHGSFTIGRAKVAACQLPDSVVDPDGNVFSRPEEWSAGDIESDL